MGLASARLRGIHPPENIQNGGRPRRQHFDDQTANFGKNLYL
jgi:hypothetical protein